MRGPGLDGLFPLRMTAGVRMEDARLVGQWLVAIICNQLAKQIDLAQHFSTFGVQLGGSPDA